MKRFIPATAMRPGFTLLEALMALALSSMLLVAVVAAIDLSIRMSVATPRSLHSAERSAALMRIVATDLRRMEPLELDLEPSKSSHWSKISVVGDEWEGLIGAETWLAGRLGAAAVQPSHANDERMVEQLESGGLWFVYSNPDSPRDTFLTSSAPHWLAVVLQDARSSQGITRLIASEAGISDHSLRTSDRGARSCEIFAFDLRCRFRYHDGKTWSSEWNSRVRRSLPQSIEITLSPSDGGIHDETGSLDALNNQCWKRVVSLADRSTRKGSAAFSPRNSEAGLRR